jgi:antitoxin PrlF
MGTTLTVTAKGQITLRRELLDHLGVSPGDKILVDLLPSGRAEVRAAKRKGTIEDFIGSLRDPASPVHSIEEINQAIAGAWAGKR